MSANKLTVWPAVGALAMRWLCSARLGLVAALLLASAAALSSEPEALRGPDVTIIAGEERTVYEYRQNGHLRMVKIVPKWGKPYYLFPRDQTTGFGDLEEADMLLPTWVVVEF